MLLSLANGQNLNCPLDKQSLIDDYDCFVKLLEDTHVDPYTPIGGRLNFNIRVADYKRKLYDSKCSETEFPGFLSEFVSYLDDNHTKISVENKDFNTNKSLPFVCGVTTDGIYIQSVREEYKKWYGAKILAVNDCSIEGLYQNSRNLETSENVSNLKANLAFQIVHHRLFQKVFHSLKDSVRLKMVTVNLDTVYHTFNYLAAEELNRLKWFVKPANIKIDKTGIFNYQFVDSGNKIMYFRLDEMFSQEALELIKLNHANHGNWPVSMLRYYPDLNAMNDKEAALKRIPYLSDIFKQALIKMKEKQSEYLILDLSQNGGGYSEITTPLLYMLFGDRCFSIRREAKRARKISQLFLDKYHLTIEEYNAEHRTNYKVGDYEIDDFIEKKDLNESNASRRQHYLAYLNDNRLNWGRYLDDVNGHAICSPKIIVLTSASTNSAAYHFLCDLYRLDKIKVVGVAPKQAGNTPMEGTPFVLPKSKVKGTISNSYQRLFEDSDEKAKIFTPDYPLNWIDFQKRNLSSSTMLEVALERIIEKKEK